MCSCAQEVHVAAEIIILADETDLHDGVANASRFFAEHLVL